jgi:HD-like signal output (HDOD) protein
MAKTTWAEWIRSGDWAREDEAKIPMLPAHIQEMAQLAFDPDVTTKRMATAVAKDPVLAAHVIRMANSAFSAPAIEITDIGDAVARIGTRSVRNVVIAGCLSAQLVDPKVYGPRGRQIVDHCLGTALVASMIELRPEASGEIFLCGLLHDIGKLLILKLAYEYRRETPDGATADEVDAVIGERHAQMGGWLAGRWKMPATLSDPIVWHHDPEWAADRAPVLTVYAANRLAHRYGFGCDADTCDVLEDPIMGEAGVNAGRLAVLDATAPERYKLTRHVIGL